MIKQQDGVFSEHTATCDGSTYDVIMQTACVVTVQALMDPPYPYLLPTGASVLVKVIAYNSIGESPESPVGNGALVKLSYVPDAPILE